MKRKNQKEKQVCLVCGKKQRSLFSYKHFNYCICPNCALVSTYPYPTQQQMEEHYRNKFRHGNYFLARKFSEEYKNVYMNFFQLLEKLLKTDGKTIKNKKVLDVGCFTGDFLEILQNEGADIYGLELQKEAVVIANKKLGRKVRAADVMTDAFPKVRFDVITLLGVVEHVTDPLKLIHRSSQLLKPGGIIMVQTPNSSSLLSRVMRQLWPPYAPIEHIHLFSRKSLTLALKKNGFNEITFTTHVKNLPLGYVYDQFKNFGPEFYKLFRPFETIIKKLSSATLPFYGGEMIMMAKKK